MKFSIGGVHHPSFNSANTVSIDIFLSGCLREPKCKGCHNPELWDRKNGVSMELSEITDLIYKVRKENPIIKSVCIMGGEPLHTANLIYLLEAIKFMNVELWLYTSYELDEISSKILHLCNFVKTGRYIEELSLKGERLASKNQKIHKNMGDGKYEIYYVIK